MVLVMVVVVQFTMLSVTFNELKGRHVGVKRMGDLGTP